MYNRKNPHQSLQDNKEQGGYLNVWNSTVKMNNKNTNQDAKLLCFYLIIKHYF